MWKYSANLQNYLNSRINIETMKCSYINDDNEPCDGLKTKTTNIGISFVYGNNKLGRYHN